MRVLIVGCGYVGLPLGVELLGQGHEVFGLRRSAVGLEAVKAAGIQPLQGDLTQPADLARLPGSFDWVVNTASAGLGGAAEYREVYLEGTRRLVDWLAPARLQKYVYTSSTGVYGQDDGSPVKEDAPTQPASTTGQFLVETERALSEAVRDRKFPAVVLRVAGIYGPGRCRRLEQYLRNEVQIPGRGELLMNMIHRDDLVTALLAALRSGRVGEVYNVVDDEPVAQIHFYRWLSESLGRDMPPFVPAENAPGRRREVTQKRVVNRKLKMELGVRLKYPTFRQGYTEEIQRLDRAGLLDALSPPAPRHGLHPASPPD